MPKIKVSVDKNGSSMIDFEGYQGPTCLEVDKKLRELLASLGVQVTETSFTPKPELHHTQESYQSQQHQGEA